MRYQTAREAREALQRCAGAAKASQGA